MIENTLRKIRKTVFTLNVDNYSKTITDITYPLIEGYAKKIGAEFVIIKERKFPDFPPVYEKLQIHELGRDSDWSIYIDSDTLVHPDLFDLTAHLSKDTVLHYGRDLAGNRWKYDEYFLRDGRYISSCNWFTIASDWCLDLWRPLEDLTLDQALENINPVVPETMKNISSAHLIDDYVLSRNIAKYGLKYTTCLEIFNRVDSGNSGSRNYLLHEYLLSQEEKVKLLQTTLRKWGFIPWNENLNDYIASRT